MGFVLWGIVQVGFCPGSNYTNIGLMGIIISKHVVFELLGAVKKGLHIKTDYMSHTMSVCL